MIREKSPAHQHYPADFALETSGMSTLQIGAYVLLRGICWTNFAIPKDPMQRAQMAKLTAKQMDAVWPVLAPFFDEIEDGFRHPGMEAEREKQKRWREKSAIGGKRSGESRRSSRSTVEPPLRRPSTTHEPNTNSSVFGFQSSSSSSSSETDTATAPSSDKLSERFEEFWRRYPHRVHEDTALQTWLSVVTVDNEAAVFSCLSRYERSDEWRRKIYQKPANWLQDRARNNWTDEPAPAEGEVDAMEGVTL